MKPAVCLLSGGLDSSTCLALARRDGFAAHALTVDYGQRHRVELEAAARIAASLGVVKHLIVPIDLRLFGGSALTDDLDVPKSGATDGIPITYVPARNTVFLSLALAWAEVLASSDIFIGVTKAGVENRTHIRIHTPLVSLAKADIIRLAQDLGVDFRLTHSCYDPEASGRPCGRCDSCRLRLKGFREAGIRDPLDYIHEDR